MSALNLIRIMILSPEKKISKVDLKRENVLIKNTHTLRFIIFPVPLAIIRARLSPFNQAPTKNKTTIRVTNTVTFDTRAMLFTKNLCWSYFSYSEEN